MVMFWCFIIFSSFTLLSLFSAMMHRINPEGFGGSFSASVTNLHLPIDLLGYLIVAASGPALLRQVVSKDVRRRTGFADYLQVTSVIIINLSSIIAELPSGYATGIGSAFLNWDFAVQFAYIHRYLVFLCIMILPWTRCIHIISVPLLMLARRGGEYDE